MPNPVNLLLALFWSSLAKILKFLSIVRWRYQIQTAIYLCLRKLEFDNYMLYALVFYEADVLSIELMACVSQLLLAAHPMPNPVNLMPNPALFVAGVPPPPFGGNAAAAAVASMAAAAAAAKEAEASAAAKNEEEAEEIKKNTLEVYVDLY